MGYACPVCGTPQRDGEHLAHHLAFTAMIHGDDHEAWLDEHAPDWGGMDPAGLAETVVSHAEETAYHEVFEDTVDRGRPDVDVGLRGGGHAGVDGHDHAAGDGSVDVSGLDPEAAAAVREARELTREMHGDAVDANDERGGNDTADTDDADHASDTDDADHASDADGAGEEPNSCGSDSDA